MKLETWRLEDYSHHAMACRRMVPTLLLLLLLLELLHLLLLQLLLEQKLLAVQLRSCLPRLLLPQHHRAVCAGCTVSPRRPLHVTCTVSISMKAARNAHHRAMCTGCTVSPQGSLHVKCTVSINMKVNCNFIQALRQCTWTCCVCWLHSQIARSSVKYMHFLSPMSAHTDNSQQRIQLHRSARPRNLSKFCSQQVLSE